MNAQDLEVLNSNVDKVVRIFTRDGESLLATVILVSTEDEDVIYDLVSTSKEAQYEKFDQQPAYRITFQEIESVEQALPPSTRTGSPFAPDQRH
jgi:hypothetical protein